MYEFDKILLNLVASLPYIFFRYVGMIVLGEFTNEDAISNFFLSQL